MGLDRKKLQKKRAKRVAKNKARKIQIKKKTSGITISTGNMAMNQALKAPIYECWEPEQLFEGESGVGTIVVTRKTQRNEIVMAIFLLDVFCLGVKNAYISMMFEKEYQLRLEHIGKHEQLRKVDPSYARKLVEDAEKYAKDLGFSPHKDYHLAKQIFGDIKTETCSVSFEFGREGKPFYIAGPNDSDMFANKVINQLMDKCGPGGSHYLLPLNGLFVD